MNDATKSPVMNAVVIVLAVIGGLTVLGLLGMALMHAGMMGSLGC